MKKKLTDNMGLKILALFFAIALWFIVVNINDPIDRTTFRNIPVEILNGDMVTKEGKIFEVLDNTDVIDVTVWANRSILDSIRRDNIIATADMEEVNISDTMVRIKISSNRYNDRIDSFVPSIENMSIKIENLVRKQLYITASTVGEPANGHILGTVKSEQNLIRVSGPESIMRNVARAEASVDISGLSQVIRTSAPIVLYDDNGNIIDDNNVRKSIDTVPFNVEILKVVTLPVDVKIGGTPAEGFAMSGLVDVSPSSITVAGSETALKGINVITIPDTEISINGEMGNLLTTVDATKYLPAGVKVTDGSAGKINVTVQIERLTTVDVNVDREVITFANVPTGASAEVTDEDEYIRVRVRGLAANLAMLPNTLIPAHINVGEYMRTNGIVNLEAGEYEMPLELTLPEGIKQDSIVSVRTRISR